LKGVIGQETHNSIDVFSSQLLRHVMAVCTSSWKCEWVTRVINSIK